jgi:hypothetical protein
MTGPAEPARSAPVDLARAREPREVDGVEARSTLATNERFTNELSTVSVRAGAFRIRPLQTDVDEAGGH